MPQDMLGKTAYAYLRKSRPRCWNTGGTQKRKEHLK